MELNYEGYMLEDQPLSELDEIMFWINQIGEHMLFIELGILDSTIRGTTYGSLKMDLRSLYNESKMLLEKLSGEEPLTSTMRYVIREFLSTVDDQLVQVGRAIESIKYIGFIYEDSLSHYREEHMYFRRFLDDNLDDSYKIESYLDWNLDHAKIINRLKDDQSPILEEYSSLRVRDEEWNELLELSESIWNDLGGIFGDMIGRDEGPIHPMLLAHIIREGNRGRLILESYEE